MNNFRNSFVALFCISVLFTGCKTTSTYSITSENIYKNVEWLASDEMQGRHFLSIEAKRAASYISEKWTSAGWSPLLNHESMYIPIDVKNASPNVVAMWQGTEASYVLLIAHYDHLRPRKTGEDRIYNGADDNASGTAALITIAEAFEYLQPKLTSCVVLVAFSGEEAGLLGSRHFVKEKVIPLHQIVGVINLDMISRGEPNTIFLEGTPDSPLLSAAILLANKNIGLTIIKDKHPDWMYRGDQEPFWMAGVPAVFLSVEDHEDYHEVTDHADKIMPELAAKTANLVMQTAIDLARPVVP